MKSLQYGCKCDMPKQRITNRNDSWFWFGYSILFYILSHSSLYLCAHLLVWVNLCAHCTLHTFKCVSVWRDFVSISISIWFDAHLHLFIDLDLAFKIQNSISLIWCIFFCIRFILARCPTAEAIIIRLIVGIKSITTLNSARSSA